MKTPQYFGILLSALWGVSECAPAATSKVPSNLIFITIEEHLDSHAALVRQQENRLFAIMAKVMGADFSKYVEDITKYRLPSMDENNIRMQVVSNDPTPKALHQPKTVTKINKQLAAKIAPYPERLRGFCFLPMAYPQAAADELERCVSEHGFLGALIDNHLNNMTFYDSTAYDPFWEAAQRLDVPIYLHPTYSPTRDVTKPGGRETPHNGDYDEFTAALLSAHGFDWHVTTGLSFVRLWLGGVFDRFPQVKLVIGHMGDSVPFMLDRVNNVMGEVKTDGVSVKDAWKNNVWVTTSGFFSLDNFAMLKSTTTVDRIMFSVDYPWSTNEDGFAFMKELKTSDLVTAEEWDMVAFKNSMDLLKM